MEKNLEKNMNMAESLCCALEANNIVNQLYCN